MTASETAKKIGLASLRELAMVSCTSESSLGYMYKHNKDKFLCLAYGALALTKLEDEANDQRD